MRHSTGDYFHQEQVYHSSARHLLEEVSGKVALFDDFARDIVEWLPQSNQSPAKIATYPFQPRLFVTFAAQAFNCKGFYEVIFAGDHDEIVASIMHVAPDFVKHSKALDHFSDEHPTLKNLKVSFESGSTLFHTSIQFCEYEYDYLDEIFQYFEHYRAQIATPSKV